MITLEKYRFPYYINYKTIKIQQIVYELAEPQQDQLFFLNL